MDVKSLLILKCFCLFILYFNPIVEGDSQFGKCANSHCTEPVGIGVTLIRYTSPDDNKISVGPNEEVTIFVKDYGPKKDLWGVVVQGHRGYISKNFIKETKAFARDLVPANVEFKSNVLVSADYSVTSHLHVSSHHQSESLISNTVPNTFVPSQSFQSDYMNSIPNSEQAWNSANENLQASHLPPNFDSSDPAQFGSVSNFDQSSQPYNVPQYSSQIPFDSENSLSSFHDPNMMSGNILPSQSYSSGMTDSSLYQSNPVMMQSSLESEQNIAPNSHFTNTFHASQSNIYEPNSYSSQSQHYENPSNILPSQQFQSHQSFNEHFSSSQLPQQQFQPGQSINEFASSVQQPDQQFPSAQSVNYHPSNIQLQLQQSQGGQSFSGHPSNFEHQHSKPLYISENHPSFYPGENFDPIANEEFSKTFAMLNDMGMGDDYMYLNSESQGQQSSQYAQTGLGSNEALPNINPSQSQYSPIQSSDIPLHSSLNSGGNIDIESKKVESNVLRAAVTDSFTSKDVKTESITVESKTSAADDFKENNEELDLGVLDETDDAVEDAEESDDDDEEENEPNVSEEGNEVSGSTENSSTDFHLKSSLDSASVSDESSKDHESSTKMLNLDSHLADFSGKEHNTILKQEEISATPIEVSSSAEPMHSETKISDDSVTMQTTVQTSLTMQDQSSDTLNVTDDGLKDLSGIISDIFSSDLDEKSADIEANEENNFKANDILDNALTDQELSTPSVNNFFKDSGNEFEVNKLLNDVDSTGDKILNDVDGIRSTYQNRNLKGEHLSNEEQQADPDVSNEENNTDTDSDGYSSFGNGFNALKSFIDNIMSWIPEPLYSVLMDLQTKGISPRVPVFTALFGIVCIFFIVPIIYIKEWSKENRLISQLAEVEKNAYTLSATNSILEEKIETIQSELSLLQTSLEKEKNISESLKIEFDRQADELENTKAELESYLEELETLREKENEYLSLITDKEKEIENLLEHKTSLDKIITDQENSIESLTNQLQESENNINDLEKEKLQLIQTTEDYEGKITLLDRNCNQLLQEAEVWNQRVNELTTKINEETSQKQELEASLNEKNEEIESLKQLVETFKSFEEVEVPDEDAKTKEEKLQFFLNSSMILNNLKKEEEKSKVLEEQLAKEKDKILEMEVELMEAKSEIDKLKMSYNQALQDKAEAQTKLDVLTNYFKDKEIQLQKQLGAQEAVRQKKEEDANSAERRICLIEQENASYKYQVASMKQEMEETERNLKSQIAAQEKKAHENWIAARAAERKLEDMKQEVTQLRQRLTLLEREQENWNNSSRDDIIRPVPKRIPGVNEETNNQDLNTSERGMFAPPPLHDRLPPLPPMMLPPDRPLPPLPPPPIPPMFLPPMERHFRAQPWHLPPDHSSEYRTTPPEFIGGRESTPPRGRQSTITDGDVGPNTSSPLTTDTRDSRNSTPPHLLPDFHDLPPQPGRPFFPPPHLGHPRLPMPPPYRRDQLPKRLDNTNEYNTRGSQQPPPQEQWQHSRV